MSSRPVLRLVGGVATSGGLAVVAGMVAVVVSVVGAIVGSVVLRRTVTDRAGRLRG
ncbi:hypothetical protein V3N99_20475 [Dermatophilaceae bacterium Soc4.6]